jgi:hypothetical protein
MAKEEDVAQRRRLKGILALLPDTASMCAYDEAAWNSKQQLAGSAQHHRGMMMVTTRRQRKRTKRQAAAKSDDLENGISDAPTGTLTVRLTDIILHETDVAVLFLFDPYQPYSVKLLQKLVSVCHPPSDDAAAGTIHLLAVTQRGDCKAVVNQLLQHSGVLLLPYNEDASFAGLQLAVGFSSCPAIAVLDCHSGRKVSCPQEDLAVDWNQPAQVRDAWLVQRSSALTSLQHVQAVTLFPSSSCTIQ